MAKLILVLLLGVCVWIYSPAARVYAADAARPALTPVFRWQTKREMSAIAHELELAEREGFGRLPDEKRFRTWLEQTFTGDATVDHWGARYSLTVTKESFTVVSWGPDGLPDTMDDIHIARRRAGLNR